MGDKVRIAIVTGTKAYPIIKEMVDKAKSKLDDVDMSIVILPVSVIGMVNIDTIKHIVSIKKELLETLRHHDYVLLPGKVVGDASELERLIERPVYKGTTEPSHLTEVIKLILEGRELSRIEPADKFIESTKLDALINTYWNDVISGYEVAFEIGGLKVPLRGPPVVLASETTVTLSPEEAAEQASYYERQGADIVIVGAPYGEETSKSIERLKAVDRAVSSALIAIDSASPHTLKKALEYGVELVFSIHEGNLEYLAPYAKKGAFVVIPGNPYRGVAPSTEGEAIAMLLRNLSKARDLGYDRILADLILPPPILGLSRVISAYLELGKTLKDVPLMAGLANVTELVDADSIGVNALLSILAVEVGISMVLVSEESWKAVGSTLETRLGLTLASVAKAKGAAPVGQGIDLLLAKDKKKPISTTVWKNAKKVIEVNEEKLNIHGLDKWGYAIIDVDYKLSEIIACIHKYGSEPVCYKGGDPLSIARRILSDYREFTLEHAAYLGLELEKAYIALKLKKQYRQDEELIKTLEERYRDLVNRFRLTHSGKTSIH